MVIPTPFRSSFVKLVVPGSDPAPSCPPCGDHPIGAARSPSPPAGQLKGRSQGNVATRGVDIDDPAPGTAVVIDLLAVVVDDTGNQAMSCRDSGGVVASVAPVVGRNDEHLLDRIRGDHLRRRCWRADTPGGTGSSRGRGGSQG